MWHDIFIANREAVLQALDTYRADLDELRGAIQAGDGQFLMEVLTHARGAREYFGRILASRTQAGAHGRRPSISYGGALMSSTAPVITLDGPGGSGKGTLAALVARQLGWNLLDSGALYRLLAFAARNHGVDYTNEESLKLLAAHLDVQFLAGHEHGQRIILEGEDVTDVIRTEEVARRLPGRYPARRRAMPCCSASRRPRGARSGRRWP